LVPISPANIYGATSYGISFTKIPPGVSDWLKAGSLWRYARHVFYGMQDINHFEIVSCFLFLASRNVRFLHGSNPTPSKHMRSALSTMVETSKTDGRIDIPMIASLPDYHWLWTFHEGEHITYSDQSIRLISQDCRHKIHYIAAIITWKLSL
jgi:hypothetical protein